jgi:hypothetical protein
MASLSKGGKAERRLLRSWLRSLLRSKGGKALLAQERPKDQNQENKNQKKEKPNTLFA